MPGIIQAGYGLAFKSSRDNYDKERDGRKANTVRFMTLDEEREITEGLAVPEIKDLRFIEIWEVDGTPEGNQATGRFIPRRLTDVTRIQADFMHITDIENGAQEWTEPKPAPHVCYIFSWDSREA